MRRIDGSDALRLKADRKLLVFGASGGVGFLAVWLANEQGITVLGTARSDAQEYVRKLGAIDVFDPR